MYPRLVAAVVRAVGDAAIETYVRSDPPVAITTLMRAGFAEVAAGLPEPAKQEESMTVEPADVVISGAGPNGLMLACELALAGVRPVVLDRLPGPSDEPKANGLVGQVIRQLDMRGLYHGSAATTARRGRRRLDVRRHAAELPALSRTIRCTRCSSRSHAWSGCSEKRARDLGVDVRWGTS